MMSDPIRAFAAFVASLSAAFVLQGCAGVAPGRLKPVDSSKVVLLKGEFSYETLFKLSGLRLKTMLAPGRYISDVQDGDGVYYRGPKGCLSMMQLEAPKGATIGKVISVSDCGIYVFNDTHKEPRVFVVIGSGRAVTDGKTSPLPSSPTYPDPLQTQAIATTAVPRATPLQAGVGGAVGGTLVGAIVAAEQGNYRIQSDQPTGSSLRESLSVD